MVTLAVSLHVKRNLQSSSWWRFSFFSRWRSQWRVCTLQGTNRAVVRVDVLAGFSMEHSLLKSPACCYQRYLSGHPHPNLELQGPSEVWNLCPGSLEVVFFYLEFPGVLRRSRDRSSSFVGCTGFSPQPDLVTHQEMFLCSNCDRDYSWYYSVAAERSRVEVAPTTDPPQWKCAGFEDVAKAFRTWFWAYSVTARAPKLRQWVLNNVCSFAVTVLWARGAGIALGQQVNLLAALNWNYNKWNNWKLVLQSLHFESDQLRQRITWRFTRV